MGRRARRTAGDGLAPAGPMRRRSPSSSGGGAKCRRRVCSVARLGRQLRCKMRSACWQNQEHVGGQGLLVPRTGHALSPALCRPTRTDCSSVWSSTLGMSKARELFI